MDSGTPLLQIAMEIVREVCPAISATVASTVERIFGQFINGHISFENCKEILFPIIRSTSPVEKINAILQIYSPKRQIIPQQKMCNTQELRLPRNRNSTWSEEEDALLVEAVKRYGTNDWRLVSSHVGNGKSAPQCSQRWNRGINPKISKLPWSTDEDNKLLSFAESYGTKSWTKIATLMRNRSDVQCRYRFIHLTKHNNVNSHATSPPTCELQDENFFGISIPFGQPLFEDGFAF